MVQFKKWRRTLFQGLSIGFVVVLSYKQLIAKKTKCQSVYIQNYLN